MMTTAVRILVVDDEQHVRNSLATWFREEGYDVSVAASGKDALAVLTREGTNILLVDIKMPGMDGLELQRKVRELPCCAALASSTPADAARCAGPRSPSASALRPGRPLHAQPAGVARATRG